MKTSKLIALIALGSVLALQYAQNKIVQQLNDKLDAIEYSRKTESAEHLAVIKAIKEELSHVNKKLKSSKQNSLVISCHNNQIKEISQKNEKIALKVKNKNRLDVLAGIGPSGILYRPSQNKVEQILGNIVGVGYSRSFDNNNSIGVEVLSNKTFLLKLGKEF